MKKLVIIISTALMVVVAAYIFYACNKDGKDNADTNLKKEAEFVAKNYEETCVQVQVFRDGNNNAHFVTKMVANDPKEHVILKVSDELNLATQQTKDGGEFVIEIPNDAIYWLVPLDSHEPFKFAPINNGAKNSVGGNSGTIQLNCSC